MQYEAGGAASRRGQDYSPLMSDRYYAAEGRPGKNKEQRVKSKERIEKKKAENEDELGGDYRFSMPPRIFISRYVRTFVGRSARSFIHLSVGNLFLFMRI